MIAGAGDVLICSHVINLAKWKFLGAGILSFASSPFPPPPSINCFILRLFWLCKLILASNLEKGCWAFLGRLMLSAGGSSRSVTYKPFATQIMWYLKWVSLKIQTVSYFYHYFLCLGNIVLSDRKAGLSGTPGVPHTVVCMR